MYQVIIADDEKIIREGLKNIVSWEDMGFEITEVFTDGQEIIEYLDYRTPDVILTDIKMNQVSGIDVAKFVFEHKIPCKIVLISGYQEFELALQGIKYGAEGYLLKPTNIESITEIFTKIKVMLDNKRMEDEKAQADKDRIEEVSSLLEERFFTDLILGVVDSEEYIKNRMAILYPKLDTRHSKCLLVDIIIDNYEEFMDSIWKYNYDQFEVNISNLLRIYNNQISFHIIYKSNNIIELFGIFVKKVDENTNLEKLCQDAMNHLLYELESTFKVTARYLIKKIFTNIFEISTLREDFLNENYPIELLNQHLQERKKLIMSNISVGNMVTAQKIFQNILEELEQAPSLYRNNFVIEILSTMNALIKEVNIKLSDSLQSYFNYAVILSFNSTQELKAYCDRIFDRIKLAEEKKEYYDTNSLISKAKSYIMDNIERDISQEETANHLYICSSYLSRLFKKQTGENFTQYVTRMKIEKAIELLRDPQYKTYHVSEALGYKTPRYFSRLFRIQTGMNPSEYRRKVLHIGGECDEN